MTLEMLLLVVNVDAGKGGGVSMECIFFGRSSLEGSWGLEEPISNFAMGSGNFYLRP